MVSDFMRRKLQNAFNAFDADKDGTVGKKDFQLAIENVAKYRGYSAGDAKYEEAKTFLLKLWDNLSNADANKDGEVTFDEWLSIWSTYAKNPAGAAEWQKDYCRFIFRLEDATHDGSIDCEEFSSVFASFGRDKSEAEAAFKKLSRGKASINWDEFQELWKEYFISEDPNAPGNCIFGRVTI